MQNDLFEEIQDPDFNERHQSETFKDFKKLMKNKLFAYDAKEDENDAYYETQCENLELKRGIHKLAKEQKQALIGVIEVVALKHTRKVQNLENQVQELKKDEDEAYQLAYDKENEIKALKQDIVILKSGGKNCAELDKLRNKIEKLAGELNDLWEEKENGFDQYSARKIKKLQQKINELETNDLNQFSLGFETGMDSMKPDVEKLTIQVKSLKNQVAAQKEAANKLYFANQQLIKENNSLKADNCELNNAVAELKQSCAAQNLLLSQFKLEQEIANDHEMTDVRTTTKGNEKNKNKKDPNKNHARRGNKNKNNKTKKKGKLYGKHWKCDWLVVNEDNEIVCCDFASTSKRNYAQKNESHYKKHATFEQKNKDWKEGITGKIRRCLICDQKVENKNGDQNTWRNHKIRCVKTKK